jgi:site-specific recombinase XerD
VSDLEPITPEDAAEMWLNQQRTQRADSTIQSYEYRLSPFLEWCETEGIDDLIELSSRDVFRYEAFRRGDGLAVPTLNNQIGTLKRFLSFCERIEAIEEGLTQKVEVPTSDEFRDMVNESKLTASRASEILEVLDHFAYASRKHAVFALMWHTGCRVGGIRALDVADVYLDTGDLERLRHRDDIDEEVLEEVELPFVFFQHRPEAEPPTPLKNKREGERPVALDQSIADVLEDYININRTKRRDPGGRQPLFTTKKGQTARISKSGVRRLVYIITQPCRFGECPHDRDPVECEAVEHGYEARCPSSRSPHPIRTGRITDLRDKDWPPEVVGERVDATPETIRLHYDLPDKIRRMQSRRKYLEDHD